MRGVVTIRGPVDVECQCAAWRPGCVLAGLMFFSLELSLSRVAPQSHSRSWSVTGAHVQGRLKEKGQTLDVRTEFTTATTVFPYISPNMH